MGGTSRRLSKLLSALGYEVHFFVIARGWYRTSRCADCFRWEAWATDKDGYRVLLSSWDTMTDCLKHGIEISTNPFRHNDDGSIVVCAKLKPNT